MTCPYICGEMIFGVFDLPKVVSGNVPPSSAPDLCFELFGQTCHFCLHIGDHHFGRGTNKVNKTHPDFECLMSLALQREKQKKLW